MKESVLAESVKAALNGKRIRAALFLTFNFDALFFENYILPLCMDPNLEFGASAAKNALLWLRHGNELPPVTVICDYYAKNNAEPPRLDYDVVCVAMEKSFFHPKNIFLLCDDGELLFLAGSANMSYSGWCHNIETMSMITFRGDANQDEAAGEVRNYLDHIRGLVAAHTADSAIPEAFNTIRRYFRNARAADPKNPALAFHHSTNGSFSDFLESLREKHNRRQPFETIEIVSPYLSQDASAEQYGRLAAMAANGVDLALPWSKPGQAGLARTLYDALPKKGYRWRSLSAGGGNQFRFAHGKAYRFKGEEKMITVVGSVNFTRQGFARFGGEGPEAANIETAVAIVEPVDRWTSIFSDQSPAPVSFSTQDELALDVSARVEIPPLFFTLDWGEKKLFYRYGEKWKEPCRLSPPDKNRKPPILWHPGGFIQLGDRDLEYYAESCAITVFGTVSKTEYCFFPRYENYAERPVPQKLRFSIPEIFNLWASLGDEKRAAREINEAIDRVYLERVNENDEIAEEDTSGLGSINLMAQHLSGIGHLHRHIFSGDGQVSNKCRPEERTRLLFSDGLDTLPHYCRQLARLARDEQNRERLPLGFYWLVLSIVKKKFYPESNSRIKGDMDEAPHFAGWLASEVKSARKTLEGERGIDPKLLSWAENAI